MNHKDKISSLSTFLPVELFAFLVALKGEMAMFYMKVIFCFGLQPTASHEVHTTPAERQKKCSSLMNAFMMIPTHSLTPYHTYAQTDTILLHPVLKVFRRLMP